MRRRPQVRHWLAPSALLLASALPGCAGLWNQQGQGGDAATVASTSVPTTANPAQATPSNDHPSPQQAAQAAVADTRPGRPLRRLSQFIQSRAPEKIHLWRAVADAGLPGPDLANFPNSSYTLPKGGIYVESSPVGFYGSSAISSSQWNWEYLLRYGLTDDIELRLFSNGLSVVSGATGFSPVAFDSKAHLWEKDWDWFNVSLGIEAYVQTSDWLASPAFYGPTQYSLNLLVDHELPWEVSFSWNIGFVEQANSLGHPVFLTSVQWAFQRNVTDSVAVFVHGYYNADALPRLPGHKTADPTKVESTTVGFGGQWVPSKRIAFYGSYNWGLNQYTPSYNANLGFVVSF